MTLLEWCSLLELFVLLVVFVVGVVVDVVFDRVRVRVGRVGVIWLVIWVRLFPQIPIRTASEGVVLEAQISVYGNHSF